MAGSGLTARQAAFCEAFVLGGSAAAAARAAGYSATGARTQAWRLLQQPAVRRRLQELRYSAQASETAFAARLMARAERLWDAAQADDNHGLALRALQMQFRIAGRYGAPPTSLVMGDEAALNDLTLTALVAETRHIELPAGVDIGPDVRAAAMTRPDGRVPHPDLPPGGKGRCGEGGEPSHPPGRGPHSDLPPEGKGRCGEGGEHADPLGVPSPSEEGQPPQIVPSPLGEGQDGGRAEGASGVGDSAPTRAARDGDRDRRPHLRASVNIPPSAAYRSSTLPQTLSAWPETLRPPGLHRNSAIDATSSGSTMRRSDTFSR